jgi:ribonuclease HII
VAKEYLSGGLFDDNYDISIVAGADEAGVGALAGPVAAAAVILTTGFDWSFLRDSKVLTPDKRLKYSSIIKEHALSYAIAFISHKTIDRINILNARLLAMKSALLMLKFVPQLAFIDGNRIPNGLPFKATAIVDGDSYINQISAASIIAKVERDDLMTRLSYDFKGYGFEKHFGYSTAFHKERMKELGCCKIHRKTYAPVRESINPRQEANKSVHDLPL